MTETGMKITEQERKWEYDFAGYDETGIFYKVNRGTGEIMDIGTMKPVFNGDRVITAEQQAAWNTYKQREEEKAKHRDLSKKNGSHFFVPRMQNFPDLKPQTATRLIYLLTFATYTEKKNQLMKTQKKAMRREDLPKLLGLSKDSVDDFMDEVCPSYLTEDENKFLFATETAYLRGKLKNGSSYHRLYDTWVRSLYIRTPKTKHKHLGHLFKMLPYINIEYNTLCYNPTEKDLNKIEYLRLAEFCDIIDFDKSHLYRLLSIYKQLRFEVYDESGAAHTERFVSMTFDGLDRSNAKVFVNPRILYSGAHPKQVEILGSFSKD